MLNETKIQDFKARLRGELLQRSDPEYEEARRLYNGMIDKRPLLIARCADVADVIAAVRFGREQQPAHCHSRRRPQRAGTGQLRRRAGDRPLPA